MCFDGLLLDALLDAVLRLVDALLVLLHEEFKLLDPILVLLVHLVENLLEELLVASLGTNSTRALQAALCVAYA